MDHQVESSDEGRQENKEFKVDELHLGERHENSHKPSRFKKSWKTKLFGTRNKKIVITSSAMVILLAGSFGWRLLNNKDIPLPTNVTNEVPMLGAAVTVIDGTAEISSDGEDWESLTTETVIKRGDIINTDQASRVVITLEDGSEVRLDESTQIKVENISDDEVRLANLDGNVYNRVVASNRKYIVSVDETDYTALGTAFNVVNKPTDKGVQVLQSSVQVEGEESKVDEGKQFYGENAKAELTDKITDLSVDELKSNEFMMWNLEKDVNHEEFKDKLGFLQKVKEQPAEEPATQTQGASINLTAKTNDKGIALSWTLTNVKAPDGFKVVRSKKSATPTYGKDEATYVGAADRSTIWKTGDGLTYTYRVCVYVPSSQTCTNYSNAVSIKSPVIEPEKPVSGAVTLSLSGTTATWTFAGTAPHGFKVNISTSPNPTYGGATTKSIYTGSPYEIDTTELQSSLGAGPYYIRVCKYTSSSYEGGCMDYSNEVTL